MPVGVLAGAGVAQQVQVVAGVFQVTGHIGHALHRHDGVVPPPYQILRCTVQVLGQAGLHPRQRIVVGDGAAIHAHPFHSGQHLAADQVGVRLAEAVGEQTDVEVNQHLPHVKYDVSDHSCSPGSSTALSPLRRNTPVMRFRMRFRRALASSRSPRSRPPTP